MSHATNGGKHPFLWGAATSSHQVEGGNRHNDWWAWEEQGNIEGGVKSGAATDHWNRFREDLRLAKEMGLNSYRFSIEWSRIEPQEGKWDLAALGWYRDLVLECERNGLMPMATLHHFTSPKWFADQGGFANDDSPAKFVAYVEKVLESFGNRVPLWCTINEPMVLVVGGYLGSFMPPAKFDPKGASAACRNLLRCHVDSYDLIHRTVTEREGPWKDHPLMVGLAHNMLDLKADRWWHPIERSMQWAFWRFYNYSWLEAVTGGKPRFGLPGILPNPKPVENARGRRTAEFIGINYYTKAYLKWRPRDASAQTVANLPIGVAFARRKEPVSDVDWAIHPAGLSKIIAVVSRYGLPMYITENGIADKSDDLRPAYLVSHLKAVANSVAAGHDVRGYYYWSLLDNFEWVKGYGPRFGLLYVNYDNFERKRTRSAEIYRQIISRHGTRAEPDPSLISP
jgi:beta-glucosidase